ncbi:MAG: DUF1232 domain-containing protein [Anaerovibrio sp.]|uniref:YkvA family protein n=1 Tax=Anaerovibrio sp. TaxID=1872532 RepID=UPI0025D6B3C8|nr:DUF1232 domain-containing protein [Anaerovibrio sp.]MCR5176742.1 DUF1232 domain-containing protein [Anaerovibrio sp.]
MKRLIGLFSLLRKDLLVILFALFNRHTPKQYRMAILAILLYFISPIDIVPDAIPFMGIVDDVVIVPSLLAVIRRFLPEEVVSDSEYSAEHYGRYLPVVAVIASLLLLLWTGMVIYGIYKLIFS